MTVEADVRAVVVECLLPGATSRVEEVRSMAESIGYKIVANLVQRRPSPHHSFTIGEGKLDELKRLVSAYGAERVVFTNTLPGAQVFKIKRRVGEVDVIDRNLLILEVFAERAMTKEAKLQIELARLLYTFSWSKELVRMRGISGEQVGLRGPGQYPYREYQAAARKKIRSLRRDLTEIRERNEALRRRRHELGYPVVALAGYTQSGKTTFFNAVAGEEKVVGLGPFTTLATCARRFRVASGLEAIIIDSIGFIEDMHPVIVDAFKVTLSEIASADLVLLFVDASEEEEMMRRKLRFISAFTQRLGLRGLVVCANKIDLLPPDRLVPVREFIARYLPGLDLVEISAKEGTNVKSLLKSIEARLVKEPVEAEARVSVPTHCGRLVGGRSRPPP